MLFNTHAAIPVIFSQQTGLFKTCNHPGKRACLQISKQTEQQSHANAVHNGKTEKIAFFTNHASCSGCNRK